ncbi:MAG: glycosyltransferase [Candidatus Margulisbacteria bacterium]|nr:glycosyltransferase [Candidatus Margulisiibacteriota bacterium]
MKKILMLVRTSGLEYDDRIRKEAISLKTLGYNVSILANYTSNKSEKGVTQYGAPYKVYSLITRKIFPSAKLLPLKMFEFWLRVFFDTLFKSFDYVWVHEEYMALNILFKPTRGKYIFDLHELPLFLTKNKKMIKLYHRIESKSYKLIVANSDRLYYMIETGLVKNKSKYYILNNFPDKVFLDLPVNNLPEKAKNFIGNSQYILMQGGGHKTRYPLEVLCAIKKYGKYKAIIVGPVANEFVEQIKNDFQDVVYIAGYIKQLELTKYIDNAWASIILYGHTCENNIYCEPNRFYQALNRGVPVIVGNNPPMKRIIEETKAGIVLKTDGRNIDDIVNGISELEKHYKDFKQKAIVVKEKYIWEAQTAIINSIVN